VHMNPKDHGMVETVLTPAAVDYKDVAPPETELWLFKVPQDFDVATLAGQDLKVESMLKEKKNGTVCSFEDSGKKYRLNTVDPSEFRQIINLFPHQDKGRLMLGKPFARAFDVTETIDVPEMEERPTTKRKPQQEKDLAWRYRPFDYVFTDKEKKKEAKKKRKLATALKRIKKKQAQEWAHEQEIAKGIFEEKQPKKEENKRGKEREESKKRGST